MTCIEKRDIVFEFIDPGQGQGLWRLSPPTVLGELKRLQKNTCESGLYRHILLKSLRHQTWSTFLQRVKDEVLDMEYKLVAQASSNVKVKFPLRNLLYISVDIAT